MAPITINSARLLERFLQYVQIETTADPTSTEYPSSSGQRELGTLLTGQLRAMGLEHVKHDEHGLVWGMVPATVPGPLPTILLNAHLDTSPEASGRNVRPQIVENYSGGDLPLLHEGKVIRVSECAGLKLLQGKTLITTDGTTLLGGDDKAGVAIIMELAQTLMENPRLPHGPVQVLFTCDEEIGRGTKHVSLKNISAVAGYTLDGGASGVIDDETFSADLATIQFRGKNIHPSIAKGAMVNAVRAAGDFLAKLPKHILAPEATDGRDGFLHPYNLSGGVAEVQLQILLRDFCTDKLTDYARLLHEIAHETELLWPGLRAIVTVERQYRNMADGLKRQPLAVSLAEKAFAALARPCRREIIRGGTDGALLTEMGLPTPNLASGQYNIHSPLEFACLEEMAQAAEHLVVLLDLWQQHGRA